MVNSAVESPFRLDWQNGPGYRVARLNPSSGGQPALIKRDVLTTGITFSNQLSDLTVARNRLYEIGSGVAIGDVDGDGLADLYFCGLENDNVLYRNLGGFKFEDITQTAGVACSNQFSTGAVFADLDGDSDLDLLVTSLGGGTRQFNNNGAGQFSEKIESGLARRLGATSMALADVDGDGDLDLYVTNYRTDTFIDNPPGLRMEMRRTAEGSQVLEPRDRFVTIQSPDGSPLVLERGEPDFLYVNRGDGKFVAVPQSSGLFADEQGRPMSNLPTDWGLAVLFRDFNGDGQPDIYICNDFVNWPDWLWLNEGGKRLRVAPRLSLRSTSLSSMAVDVADINRDGFDDFFVADMLSPRRSSRGWQRPDTLKEKVRWPISDPNFRPELPRNTLQLARGDGTFAEIAQLAGLAATDWTPSALFLDVDLDGWEDLLVGTGNLHDVQDADVIASAGTGAASRSVEGRLNYLSKLPGRLVPAMAFRNQHDLTFRDFSVAWGFNAVGAAHGMALGDLDNDGDLDVVINCMNEPARIYENGSTAPRLAVRLVGKGGNTRGIGTRIQVTGGPVTQSQEMISGGRYCSSDDPIRTFAAGEAKNLQVEVRWRNGTRTVISNALPNRVYEIHETQGSLDSEPAYFTAKPLFKNVSDRLQHLHVDEPFDDFRRNLLLPRKLSNLGPGVAWFDLDRDGHDDLLIGAGKGGNLATYRNRGDGSFEAAESGSTAEKVARDQSGILGWRDSQGRAQVLIGESTWEDSAINWHPRIALHDPDHPGETNTIDLPGNIPVCAGPIAMADIDGDGDLDLFVGGRMIQEHYPEAAPSFLFRCEGDRFTPIQEFKSLGLISGALFSDFDGDGAPDLFLAGEWGPIRAFTNKESRFADASEILGLSKFAGGWNGIASGDFDEDGRIDLVASNWGRNWRTDQSGDSTPDVELYYGVFEGTADLQAILCSNDPSISKVTPWRERKAVVAAIPSIGTRFPTHREFALAGIAALLGERFSDAKKLSARSFDSMVFLNRGDHFEPRSLPVEAQFSAGFGISVADFDGDGHDDLFLAQNFFGMDPETSRQDAGVGLVMLGDGKGGFRALSPQECGIWIGGEQRASAVSDFDGDGRADLVITQNGGPTQLYHNVGGKAGARLRLRGPSSNPSAVGARVRLWTGETGGAAHEIHAGGGYWSQDGSSFTRGGGAFPTAVEIRWPGGRSQRLDWPLGKTVIEVGAEGIQAQ